MFCWRVLKWVFYFVVQFMFFLLIRLFIWKLVFVSEDDFCLVLSVIDQCRELIGNMHIPYPH